MSVFIYDSGVVLRISLDSPLSSVSEVKLKYRKPTGETGEWIAEYDSEHGEVVYVTDETSLDAVGEWELQPYIKSDDYEIHGKKVKLVVKPLL